MKNFVTAILMMLMMTCVLGLAYPLVVTSLAQVLFKDKANGQLIERDGQLIGSRLIGQPFSSPGYFRSRPSAAGAGGYDAGASSGLDPHISPAAADFQVPRVARERGMSEDEVRHVVAEFTEGRQFGFLGEARVNVLLLNLRLDEIKPLRK